MLKKRDCDCQIQRYMVTTIFVSTTYVVSTIKQNSTYFFKFMLQSNKEINFESFHFQKNVFHASELLFFINHQEHNTRRSFDAEET